MTIASYNINNNTGKYVDIIDSGGNPVLIKGSVTVSLDSAGYQQAVNIFGAARVVLAGSVSGTVRTDVSANKPTLPNVGAAFAASGPYASYVLIATIASYTLRNYIDVENNSGAQIALIIDDGLAASGAQPTNASIFAIAGGSGAGSQGGSWTSNFEKGRVQVYAPSSGAQVSIFVN